MPEVFGQESWFNENSKFFKNINVSGKITATDSVPGIMQYQRVF